MYKENLKCNYRCPESVDCTNCFYFEEGHCMGGHDAKTCDNYNDDRILNEQDLRAFTEYEIKQEEI